MIRKSTAANQQVGDPALCNDI